MKRNLSLYLILSIILLTPSVLTSFFPDNSALIELRPIQDFPSLPKNLLEINSWPGRFNTYVEDHFILRGFLINKKSKILYDHGISISKDVLLGQNGWLFLSKDDEINKYRGIKKLSNDEANNWIKVMSSHFDFLEENGINCWLIIVPNKSTVYARYLPNWVSKVGPSYTDVLVQKLKEQKDIKWIDLRPLLIEAATKNQVYDKYETHWNDHGSYIAYQYIIQRINKEVRLSPVPENNITFKKNNVSGDLAELLSLNKFLTEDTEVAELLKTKVFKKIGIQDWLSFQKYGFATVASNSPCRAVILSDSFGLKMAKYFQETFSYAYFKHHNEMDFDKELILQQHPDIMLLIIVERYLPSKLHGWDKVSRQHEVTKIRDR